MPVAVAVAGLRDWVTLSRALDAIAAIARIDVVRMTRDGVELIVHHFGDIEQLRLGLSQQDLTLTRDGETWRMARLGDDDGADGS